MSLEAKPVLSVVVFSYNHKKYIEKCLESIFMQRMDYPCEILLADDCSPDGTAQLVWEKYRDQIRILDRKENLGLCRNMYDAFMQAEGKYIVSCSGDDYLPGPDVLDIQVRYLEDHENIFSVTGWHEIYNVATETKKIKEIPCREYTWLDFLRGVKISFYTGMMRNTFKADRPEYLYKASRNNEEVQIWYYTLTKSKKIILPECLYTYCYRNDATSSSYNATHSYLEMLDDYARGFAVIEKESRNKYQFDIARMTCYSGCIDYYIQNNGITSAGSFLKVLKIRELFSFIWIKFCMRLNHRLIPGFLLQENRLIR